MPGPGLPDIKFVLIYLKEQSLLCVDITRKINIKGFKLYLAGH